MVNTTKEHSLVPDWVFWGFFLIQTLILRDFCEKIQISVRLLKDQRCSRLAQVARGNLQMEGHYFGLL